jgi:hypothetical protein
MQGNPVLPIVTLMLYAGPLLCGLGGFGWGYAAAFSAIFLLWQIVMRPLDWPREAARWNDRNLQAAALARVFLVFLLVVALFALGRGLGSIVGFFPQMTPVAPLALSFLAIPLARMIGAHEAPAAAPAVSGDADHLAAATAKADRLLQPVQDLPDGTPAETVAEHLRAIATHVDPARLHEALIARVRAGGASPALVTALAWQGSDAALLAALPGNAGATAFQALPDAPGPLALFARRAAAALAADPGLWWSLPSSDMLAARAAHHAGTEAETALLSLMAAIDRLAQRNAG